jgi:hypothetical protein
MLSHALTCNRIRLSWSAPPLGYATRLGLDDPAEVTASTDLATPTDQRTIDPRLLALQQLYAELAGNSWRSATKWTVWGSNIGLWA